MGIVNQGRADCPIVFVNMDTAVHSSAQIRWTPTDMVWSVQAPSDYIFACFADDVQSNQGTISCPFGYKRLVAQAFVMHCEQRKQRSAVIFVLLDTCGWSCQPSVVHRRTHGVQMLGKEEK